MNDPKAVTSRDPLYEAMRARDARFDGKFFVAVKTTGIYCRPICPARPKRRNVEFFKTAQAAEDAGYHAMTIADTANGSTKTVRKNASPLMR